MEEPEKRKVVKAYLRGYSFEQQVKFLQSKVLMPISVGQPYHEGEKLEATIKLVNRKFGSCIILVADTLQRHTIMMRNPGMSEKEATDIARCSGRMWINRNMSLLENFDIPAELVLWGSCQFGSKYHNYRLKVRSLFDSCLGFNKSIESAASRFLSQQDIAEDARKLVCQRCQAYVIEECVMTCVYVKEANPGVILYPPSTSQAIDYCLRYITNTVQVEQMALEFRRKTANTISLTI